MTKVFPKDLARHDGLPGKVDAAPTKVRFAEARGEQQSVRHVQGRRVARHREPQSQGHHGDLWGHCAREGGQVLAAENEQKRGQLFGGEGQRCLAQQHVQAALGGQTGAPVDQGHVGTSAPNGQEHVGVLCAFVRGPHARIAQIPSHDGVIDRATGLLPVDATEARLYDPHHGCARTAQRHHVTCRCSQKRKDDFPRVQGQHVLECVGRKKKESACVSITFFGQTDSPTDVRCKLNICGLCSEHNLCTYIDCTTCIDADRLQACSTCGT
jgi:hypothetical protein